MHGVATESAVGDLDVPLGVETHEQQAELAAVAGRIALTLGIAALVAVSARHQGAYYIDVWAPLGLLLLCVVATLVLLRRPPALLPAISAASLVAVGVWAVLSTQWGGLPNVAWTVFGQSIVAAAALLAASALARDRRGSTIVFAGVFLGLTAQAVTVLAQVAISGGPGTWFFGRFLEGPVEYHNAQAMMFVLGLPFALIMATGPRFYVRAAGGAACGTLLAALVLTQSRGSLLAAGIAVIVVVAWTRDSRIALFSIPVAAATAALIMAMRNVDAALVQGTAATHLGELRRYMAWSVLVALALAAVAAANALSRRGRIATVVVACVCLLIGLGGGIQERGAIGRTVHRATSSSSDRANPDTAPAGATRITSLSLNGRREAWRVASKMVEEHPLAGAGVGRFTRHWGTDRRKSYFYYFILQPHSIELELLSELGIIGFGAFAFFVGTALLCAVRAPSRTRGAIAAAALVALVVEASVDWTWSFPAVVLPVVLTVGAAADPARIRRLRVPAVLAIPALVVAGLVLAVPYLADRQLDRARAIEATNPNKAWSLSLDAERLNPWDERVFALQARLAQASGQVRVAAGKYDRSATLSRQPWVGYFQEAAVWKAAGEKAQQVSACRRALAANPTDQLFRWVDCDGIG